MNFDAIEIKPCAVTSTTSTVTSTSTSTTTVTTSSTSTPTTSTICPPSSPIATVSPDVMSSTYACFGDIDPGYYLVEYVRGALSYDSGDPELYLNRTTNRGYRVVYGVEQAQIEGPAADYAGYPTLDQVQDHNDGAAVRFFHSGGTICMYLKDGETAYRGHTSAVPPIFVLKQGCWSTSTTTTTSSSTTSTSTTTTTSTSTSTSSTTTLFTLHTDPTTTSTTSSTSSTTTDTTTTAASTATTTTIATDATTTSTTTNATTVG